MIHALPDYTYKICSRDDWARAKIDGVVPPSAKDKRDGFVHLCEQKQVEATLALHFAGRKDLVLLQVKTSALAPATLRLEASRGGELFPHLYGALGVEAVVEVTDV